MTSLQTNNQKAKRGYFVIKSAMGTTDILDSAVRRHANKASLSCPSPGFIYGPRDNLAGWLLIENMVWEND